MYQNVGKSTSPMVGMGIGCTTNCQLHGSLLDRTFEDLLVWGPKHFFQKPSPWEDIIIFPRHPVTWSDNDWGVKSPPQHDI